MTHPLWANLFRHRHDWIRRTCRLCEQHPLFEKVPKRAIRWLVSRMHLRHYEAGETIFHMGDPGAGALLLLSGSVQINIQNITVATLHDGDIFGEVALATSQPRTAEGITTTPCEVVFFLRSDLQEWIDTSPRQASTLLVNLANMLAHRLLKTNEQQPSLEQTPNSIP